jgi:hypothetical protein
MSSVAKTVKIYSRWDGSLLGEFPGADIKEALENAARSKANLDGANLDGANLDGANLVRANLDGANLVRANLPSPGVVLLACWGDLSDATTLALMRLDASAHPDPFAFDRWAAGGVCPYTGVRVERAARFQERRHLWIPGPPPTLWEALCMVLDEKCPGWRGEAKCTPAE